MTSWMYMYTVRAPAFGRHQFFGTSEHYGKTRGSLLSGWMNYNYTACCWFPTPSNILILPSQFWQIRFECYWSCCSKCQIPVFLWYKIKTLSEFTNEKTSWMYMYTIALMDYGIQQKLWDCTKSLAITLDKLIPNQEIKK